MSNKKEAFVHDLQVAVLSEDLRERLAKALEALAHSVAVPATGDPR